MFMTLRSTQIGMSAGTPIGVPADIPIWVDRNVMNMDYIILGGGNRTSKLKVNPAVLSQLEHVEVVEELAN